MSMLLATRNTPRRVLLADDEALILDLIEAEVVSTGMKVVGRASDGRHAVELAGRLQPDVILMDITMPDMDGIAAAAAIQACRPTPVVILTAHSGSDMVAEAIAAGVGAYLVKPPAGAEISRAAEVAIARHGDLMRLRQINDELAQALAEVKILKGLLPICSWCKKIRDDRGYWESVEEYIQQHTGARFTHSLCPDCCQKHFGFNPQ